jgi:hypothetical protein
MRRLSRESARGVLALAVLTAGATLASADTIDGEWCLGSSAFAISEGSILTPAGNTTGGNYSRHAFSYIVPASEPGAGGQIDMTLQDEQTVRLTRGGRSSPPEFWRRCKPTS